MIMANGTKRALLASMAALAAVTAPALADVKQGVDAWSRGDYRKAVEQWRPAANAGDAQAQFNLGQAYKLGRGVPVDMALAEQWYRKAALQGLPQAETNYGLALFDQGKRGEALPWLEKSTARGEPRAQLVLGTMLFNGDGVPKDWRRAYALLVRASAAGLPSANKVLAQMDQYIPQETRQQGLVLARQYESDSQRADLPTELAGQTARPVEAAAATPVQTAEPRPAPPTVAAAAPRPARPEPRPAPAAPVAASGSWRVQLGAFGDPGNARRLWGQVAGRFAGRQPYYVKSGALTRLLVGPYGSSAEATRACAAVKPCVPTKG